MKIFLTLVMLVTLAFGQQTTQQGGSQSVGGVLWSTQGVNHSSTASDSASLLDAISLKRTLATAGLNAAFTLTDSVAILHGAIRQVGDTLAMSAAVRAGRERLFADAFGASDLVSISHFTIARPTTFSNNVGCSSPPSAYDNNLSSASSCEGIDDFTGAHPVRTNAVIDFSGIAAHAGPFNSVTLNIRAAAINGGCPTPSDSLDYSIDGGETTITVVSGLFAPTTYNVVLPTTQDFTKVVVHATAACNGVTSGNEGDNEIDIYEIWISTT